MMTLRSPQLLLEAALRLAGRGWPILPLCWPAGRTGAECVCGGRHSGRDVGKAPVPWLVPHGLHDASTDADTVRAWWQKAPQANIGLRTGPESGLFVLDVDAAKGGFASLRELQAEHGTLPDTPRAVTGGGGAHLLFAYPGGETPVRNSAERLGPGLDVRAQGGYIVAPPSLHVSGRTYAWDGGAHPDDFPLAPLAGWLYDLARDVAVSPRSRNGAGPHTEGLGPGDPIPEGQRNATLASLAGRMRRGGFSEVAILAALLEENAARCVPPLAEAEVRKIARSISRYPPAENAPIDAAADPLWAGTDAAMESSSRIPPGPWSGQAPPKQDPGLTNTGAPAPGTALTDLGNAERFIQQHGANVKFVPAWKAWVVWDSTRWKIDDLRIVGELAIRTVRSIYTEASAAAKEAETAALAAGGRSQQEGSPALETATRAGDRATALWKHAKASEANARVTAMLALAEALPGVAVRPDVFDADRLLLNCQNGTVDLRTGDLYPHRREDLLTKLCRTAYLPDAPAPTWARFLQRVMAGSADKIAYLQRAFGYSLTGMTGEECLFFLYGTGRNGKSKALGALQYLLGDYAKATRPETIMASRDASGGAPSPDLADLDGVRFAPTTETTEGGKVAEPLLKWITGGDAGIPARHLFSNNIRFTPQFKLWLAGNHKPEIRGTDEGIWSRIRTIPFTVTIPLAERDKDLGAKLEAEADGILAWCVQGCLAWQIHGLGEPEEVQQATAAYRAEMDVLGDFLSDCCVRGDAYQVTAKILYKAYTDWCDQAGEKALNTTMFGRKLTEHGFPRDKVGGVHWRYGLRLQIPPVD